MVVSAKKFLIFTICGFLFFLISYIFIFNFLVEKDIFVSHSYKEFLLKNTESPRLIIDSGSNSQHAINSRMLEDEFNILTINIADNGGYPLRYKLLRLMAHARKGDIVILPLEWGHYTYQNPTKNFLDNIFSQLNFYYNCLTFTEKIKLMFKTPFPSVVKYFLNNDHLSRYAKLQTEYLSFNTYKKLFHEGDRGDYKYHGSLPLADDGTKIKTCNEYVLGEQLLYGFVISDVFKENMQLVLDLEKQGVKVILTWPTVAGNDCYEGKYAKAFLAFVDEIKNYLDEHNISHVGDVGDSRFGASEMLNTYYHVVDTARDMRTMQLISNIRCSKFSRFFDNDAYRVSQMSFKNEYEDVNKFIISIPSNKKVYFTSDKFKNYAWLLDGWYPLEKTGVWSQGKESSVLFKVNDDFKNKDFEMVIEADTFKDRTPTKIFVNEFYAGAFVLNGTQKIKLNKNFNNNNVVTIKFLHDNIKSPADYGMNNDERKLKLRLRSLSLIQ